MKNKLKVTKLISKKMIKHVVVLLLFVNISMGQVLSSDWVNYDIKSWKNMFDGFTSSKLIYDESNRNAEFAEGFYVDEYWTIQSIISFLGPTPIKQF